MTGSPATLRFYAAATRATADYRIALVSPEGDTLRMIERVRDPVPITKAALRSLLTDTSGRIWAELFTESGAAWEVFDAQGRLKGRVGGFDYDARVAPVIRGDRLAWVDRDSLGVQRARLARIRE